MSYPSYNTPSSYPGDPLYGKFQYGQPGIATGNALLDPLIMMMMGGNMTPRPSDAARSMLQAATLRRRSLGYMNIDQNGLINNGFTNSFGGVSQGSLMANAMWMGNNMTGGAVSKFMNPMVGGNPIVAQQRLYAGLNGITSQAAFGLRGEASVADTNRMMGYLNKEMYHFDRGVARGGTERGDAYIKEVGKSVREDFAKLDKGKYTKEVEDALAKAMSGQTVEKAMEGLAGKLGEGVAEAIEKGISKASYAARNGKFGGINFQKTFGFDLEDITGGFVSAAQHSLYRAKRGGSFESAIESFDKAGGIEAMEASRIMFGGNGQKEIMENMNRFLGVSNINMANKEDNAAFTSMSHGMQALAMSAGLDPSVLVQMAEQYKNMAQQGPMGRAFGGMSAAAHVGSAVRKAQGVLTNGGDDMNGYLRRRGGTGGYMEMTMQGEEALQSGTPSQFIYSMLGAAKIKGDKDMVEHIKGYIARGDHSAAGMTALQREFSKKMGTPMGAMPYLMRDEQYSAEGAKMAADAAAKGDHSMDASGVAVGMNLNTVAMQVHQIADFMGDKSMVDDYWDAMKTSTTVEEFRKTLNEKWKTKTGKDELATMGLGSSLKRLEPIWAHVQAKHNSAVIATNKANKEFENVTREYSKSLSASHAELKKSPVAQLMNMLAGGKLSEAGIQGLLDSFAGGVPDLDAFKRALQPLASGDELGFLKGVGNVAGSKFSGIDGMSKDVLDQMGQFSGKNIDDLRKSGKAKELVAYYDSLGDTNANKALRLQLFGEEGKVSKGSVMDAAKREIAKNLGIKAIQSTDEYKKIFSEGQAALDKTNLTLSPELKAEAEKSGAYKDGKWDVAKLMDMAGKGELDAGAWKESPVAQLAKNMNASVEELKNGNPASNGKKDPMQMLFEAISGEGGLTKVVEGLKTAIENLPTQ